MSQNYPEVCSVQEVGNIPKVSSREKSKVFRSHYHAHEVGHVGGSVLSVERFWAPQVGRQAPAHTHRLLQLSLKLLGHTELLRLNLLLLVLRLGLGLSLLLSVGMMGLHLELQHLRLGLGLNLRLRLSLCLCLNLRLGLGQGLGLGVC